MDQDKDAQKDSSDGDNELENLSSDEKAAFEKIMAEIAAASGGATKASSDDAAPKTEAAENTGPTPAAPQPAAAPETQSADGVQANLDQIMSDVTNAAEKTETNDSATDNLSSDQQAALDQIMSEIDSKRKSEKVPAIKNEGAGKADEALSEDQQAALNNIMAEIGSKRKGEKTSASKDEAAGKADEALSEDQQAALNNIMAEIGAKRKVDKEISVNEGGETQGAAQADSQADIEKIMAEIETKKRRDPAAAEAASENKTTEEKSPPKQDNENLTMEEFDDELSNLLSSAQAAPPAKSVKVKTGVTPIPASTDSSPTVDAGKMADVPEINEPKTADKQEAQDKKAYPILKEISVDSKSKVKKDEDPNANRHARAGRLRKTAMVMAWVIGALVICAGGYWGYHLWRGTSIPAADAVVKGHPVETVAPNKTLDQQIAVQPVSVTPAGTPEPVVAPTPILPMQVIQIETPAIMLSAAKDDLSATRRQIQNKISDIQQLKSYYGRGIEEETQKIEDALQSGQIPSYDAALAEKKIELGMRAIQRRQIYIDKLDSPLAQLTVMSEQLLSMERRARIYEVLQAGITGLPIEEFKKEVGEAIGQFQEFNTQISIDRVEVQPLALETIWERIEAGLNQKKNLLAQRAPLNKAISAEICKGNYERKFLLSALSAETARCLVKWNGKDLYLNALTELTPEVAEILSQWPGEWLSLNGLRELKAESAKHLSQWPGKRMSLNGIDELSVEATAYLSQWKGSQLEMIGLQTIGAWENYGTRLYLSEKLRRQLEAQ